VVTDEAVVGEVVDAAAGFARRPHHLVAGDRGRRDAQRRRRHETHKCCHLCGANWGQLAVEDRPALFMLHRHVELPLVTNYLPRLFNLHIYTDKRGQHR